MPNMTKEQKYERVWNFIQYRARMHLINDLETAESEQLDEAPANQRDAIKEANKKKRLEAGLPLKISTASDVDRMQEYLSDDITKMLIGKGTPEELNEAYEIFGEINARLKVEYGKEVDQVKSRFGDTKNRDEKVYLVCQKSRTKTGYQDSELFNLSTEVGTYISNAISPETARDYNFIMGKRSEDVSKEMNEEEKRLYDQGIKMGDYEPKTAEMKEYKNGKAKQLADAYDLNNISKAYKELSAELTPSVMANITKFDTRRVDTVFMRGILKDMESTGTGKEEKAWYEKMWHSENSPEYTNMLKCINTYIGLIEANEEGKKLFIAQNKMVEAIKGYISGKETLRKHEFGQKRFDDSLRLLSQVMPAQEFDNLIKSINKERHKAKDKDHDIDVNSFNKDKKNPSPDSEYGRLRRLGLEGMDEIQKKTQEFRTNVPEPFKTKKVENRVEAVFKMNPDDNDAIHDHFYKDGTNHFKKFKPIKDEFKAIGHFTREDKLSERDFAALGYLAAGKHVDYLLVKKSEKHDTGKYAEEFEQGRQKAADALRQYEAGNKEPLAKLIADGIKLHTANYQNQFGLSDNLIVSSEMINRSYKLMERDPELMRLAVDKNVGGLTKDDIANVRGVMRGAEIISRAVTAKQNIDAYQRGGKNLKNEELIKYHTDLETYSLMNYNMIVMHSNPEKFKGNKAFKQNFLTNGTKINLGKALGSDKEIRELRKNVKDIVVKNKMTKYSTFDSEKHAKDYESFDKSLGELKGKMPGLERKQEPVKQNAKKKVETIKK